MDLSNFTFIELYKLYYLIGIELFMRFWFIFAIVLVVFVFWFLYSQYKLFKK